MKRWNGSQESVEPKLISASYQSNALNHHGLYAASVHSLKGVDPFNMIMK